MYPFLLLKMIKGFSWDHCTRKHITYILIKFLSTAHAKEMDTSLALYVSDICGTTGDIVPYIKVI